MSVFPCRGGGPVLFIPAPPANGDEIAVNDGERIVILHPDGSKTKTDDGRTEITTEWRGQELFGESRTERGTIVG